MAPPRSHRFTILLLLATTLAGCAPNPPSDKQKLNAAFKDLDAKRYEQAFAAADAYLQKTPAGPGSAEALYLEGRVYEAGALSAGANRDSQEARMQLTAAANAYLRALQLKPPAAIEGLCHAGLANSAFHLDDFPTALHQWDVAFPLIARPEAKAWVLYRIGVCQQRMGAFESADQTFARLQQEFRDQDAAQHAGALMGQRAFYLQVGVYSSAQNAEKGLTQVRQSSLPAMRATDASSGRQVVRAGPFATYLDAKSAQVRLASKFPDSAIVP